MGKVWAQVRYRAKALITAAGLAAVAIVEYVIESPDTASAIRSSVPAPYDQLLVIALAGLAITLVHRVPVGPNPKAVPSSGAVAEPLPPTPQAPAAVATSRLDAGGGNSQLPAPVEPGTATSLVTLTPFPARVTGGN